MSPFTEKNWVDSPSTTTPISAAALEDLETRLSDYTDQRSLQSATNVIEYGAVGDGSTNDTTAVTNAAAASAGGILFFPEGTYMVTPEITLPSQTIFQGAGEGSIIKARSSSASPVITYARGNSSSLRDLKVDANSNAAIGVGIEGFNDGQIQMPSIYNCQITGATTAGLRFLGGYRGVVSNTEIYSNVIGVQIPDATATYLDSLGQFDFNNCWIRDNTGRGVLLNGGSQINFFGGNIENNGSHGVEIEGTINFVYPVGFYGTHFEANGGSSTGIGLWAKTGTRALTIVGGGFFASSLQNQGFKIDSGASGITIINPKVEGHSTASTCVASSSYVLDSTVTSYASGTTVTIPAGIQFGEITGTTQIDTITATYDGHEITLYFSGSVTVRHGAGNIKLSGASNFSATNQDMLTLVYYAGWWTEKARTVI